MNTNMPRREFLATTRNLTGAAVALGLAGPTILRGQPSKRLRVGVMGVNGRGMAHVDSFMNLPEVEVAYVCDVDQQALQKAAKAVQDKTGKACEAVVDFRKILDDSSVDALSIAAPNHWHAPATILACQAGKHVYVEKPGSHTPHEAQLMVKVAKQQGRVVQLGNQRRSWPWVIEAIERLKSGVVGEVRFARTWYNNARGSIGIGKSVPVPESLNFELWQGPAPSRPYKDNLIHYNWHWHWHWGNGELGNNGIHALDVARWGLGVDYPKQVTCGGGRYYFQDDQETPDIYFTTYDFGNKGISWESHSCHPRGYEGVGFGINFSGDNGSLVIAGNRCVIYDMKGKEIETVQGEWNDRDHFADFIHCIRTGATPKSDIADTQISTMLCHYGNIAYRTGHTLNIDDQTGDILKDSEARALWSRRYNKDWKLPRV